MDSLQGTRPNDSDLLHQLSHHCRTCPPTRKLLRPMLLPSTNLESLTNQETAPLSTNIMKTSAKAWSPSCKTSRSSLRNRQDFVDVDFASAQPVTEIAYQRGSSPQRVRKYHQYRRPIVSL